MASKINTIEDLHIERMRVKILLKENQDKLDQHYQYIAGKVRPFAGIIDAFGSFSGDGEKGNSRSMWMGLVGTVLKVGLPIVIGRYFQKNSQPKSWFANIMETLGGFIDQDMIRSIVSKMTGAKPTEEEEFVDDEVEGHA